MDENGLIDSQEEYDKELQWFKDECYRPQPNLTRFNEVLNRAEKIGLFDKQFIAEIRLRISKGVANPTKEKLKDAMKFFKDALKHKGK